MMLTTIPVMLTTPWSWWPLSLSIIICKELLQNKVFYFFLKDSPFKSIL